MMTFQIQLKVKYSLKLSNVIASLVKSIYMFIIYLESVLICKIMVNTGKHNIFYLLFAFNIKAKILIII
jgi:low affinity Fe/Cu permease